MKQTEFKVEGMSCGHCVMAVKKELLKLDKIKIDDVQIGKVKVSYNENEIGEDIIKNAIEEAGYTILN